MSRDDAVMYVKVGRGEVKETRELSPGAVFADYDEHGNMLGVEFLEPQHVDICCFSCVHRNPPDHRTATISPPSSERPTWIIKTESVT